LFLRQGLPTAQVVLKLKILLPQPSEKWDYRCVPPYLTVISLIVFISKDTEKKLKISLLMNFENTF
jgi:hypothetical protein